MRQSLSIKVAVVAALLLAGCQQGGGADAGAPVPGAGGKAPGSGGKAPGAGGAQPGGTGGAPGGTGGAPGGTGGAPGNPGAGGGMDAGGTGGQRGRDAATETPPPPPRDTAPAPDTSAAGPNPELDRVCTPRVTLKLEDKGPNGKLFTDAAGGDPEPFLQEIGRAVCRVLYRQASEVRSASHLELLIKDDPDVAWKAGDGSDITVMISTRHLANIARDGGDVGYEIKGILYHEMTHMYQHDDSDGSGVDLGFIEGIADYVRLHGGYPAKHWGRPSRGGSWREGYTRAAYFLDWIDKNHPNFVYKLNLSMDSRDNKKWSPAAFQEITGKSVDQLWTEYQASF